VGEGGGEEEGEREGLRVRGLRGGRVDVVRREVRSACSGGSGGCCGVVTGGKDGGMATVRAGGAVGMVRGHVYGERGGEGGEDPEEWKDGPADGGGFGMAGDHGC
jgi:hypothetical protein